MRNLSKKNIKCYVVAYREIDGKYVKLSKSIVGHVAGSSSKRYTNVKKIKLSVKKIDLKTKGKYTIKAIIIPEDSKKKTLNHVAKFRYASSDVSVATVSKKGKIVAKKKGTCYIYVYAQNGCTAKLKVSVK